MSRIVRSHLRAASSRPSRLPPQLQEVGATAQARPLAGVSLADWLAQPQTQVMSQSSPTSLATRIDIPDSHHDFLCPNDVTMIPTSPGCLPNSEAFSSSQKAAASRVSSLFGHPRLGKLMACHVSGRPGLQETGAELDRESIATTLFSSQSKGREIETQTLCTR